MNTRFSLLDLDIDTTTHTYGVFLGNWLNINKDGKLNMTNTHYYVLNIT